ncbi:MAG: NAD(P)-dependent glycerol-3-phosphate dehydrogenase [Clostridiales bacterium]|jgi:glycerol-3-phosphate dehydrogenase (NAD(P)+)|nr:NAD(P)-dependent glycerol-3-phosphate dehydrogenase [Clostridiales bacterium]
MQRKIAVLGAGAWGITLANLLTGKPDYHVELWSYNGETAADINRQHYTRVLRDIPLKPELMAYTDAARVLYGADTVVSVVVSHGLRDFLKSAQAFYPNGAKVISATKGLEKGECKRMTKVILEEWPAITEDRLAVLSGPNLAAEIAQEKPASTVIASSCKETAQFFQTLFHSETFRVYTSGDVAGVELGGAIKNVIAIASGMCAGLSLGDNAIAAVATRGVKEISRLGLKMDAKAETFAGMAGLGDVIVTCISRQSRNRAIGEEIGKGRRPAEIMAERKSVEGIHTVVALHELARIHQTPLPICEMVYAVLFEGFPVTEVIGILMGRDPREENI